MPFDIKSLLYPKLAGLSNKSKPSAIVVHAPWDNSAESALRSAKKRVEELGYRVLNNGVVDFHASLKKKLSWMPPSGKIVLWLETHGAPGWLFSNTDNSYSPKFRAKQELESTIAFAQWVKRIEEEFDVKVDSIVLSACNSATEYLDGRTGNYFYSPARLLSKLLPQTTVVGFVG